MTGYADIQALVKTGFGALAARYLLLRFPDAAGAKAWLGGLKLASMADGRVETAAQIAFSAPGLRALGLPDTALAGFSVEFQQGMAGTPNRSRRLGDLGPDAPEHWRWGQPGREPHALLMLFAPQAQLDKAQASTLGAAPLEILAVEEAADFGGREPFGFRDGISQPRIDWAGEREDKRRYSGLMAPGEAVLGYANEYGLIPDSPDWDGFDLGRNGSYLVFRRLGQDVRGFWRWVQAHGGLPIAEAMTGRRIDGAPLVPSQGENGFDYSADADGRLCPIGAHVRRANPRTGDLPGGPRGPLQALLETLGLTGTAEADAIAATRFHRLLRRGRPFGRWLPPLEAARPDAADPQSGLNFICLNASLSRQFEFVQSAWLASAKFAGLSGEADPLTANRCPFPPGQATDGFSWSGGRTVGLPRFVSVEAGGYFFLPGLEAVRRLAA